MKSAEKTVFDVSICAVHRLPMLRKEEEAVSKGEYPDSMFKGNRPKRFPNDGKAYLLCGSGIRWTTWICPSCYRESERWRKRHKIPEG